MGIEIESHADETSEKNQKILSNISATRIPDSNSVDAIVNSDSKAPLKTPINDESDIQVKFTISDSVNSKRKCMAEKAISSFSGLTKEELLKYAKDPFWIRMRLLLFSLFWLSWLAMFVGAVAIIVMAPKCEAPKKPKWYQQGPLYEVDVKKFVDVQGSKTVLQVVKSKLDHLAEMKVKGLILSSIFKCEDGKEENVLDFKSIDGKYGSIDDFKELINEASEKEIKVILSFVPNHSSIRHSWFNQSVERKSPYDSFYIWAPASSVSSNGTKLPPNNWLSATGGSAWQWVEKREEFYLHQFSADQADLNYRNPHVLQELKDIFSYWINLGVKGFNLDKVQYLLEDKDLQNENPNGKPGAIHTDYEFYSHSKTHNLPNVANILLSWREHIKLKSNDDGILVVTGDVPVPTDSNSTTIPVDICRSERVLKNLPKNFKASDLYPRLNEIINSALEWPAVQLGDRRMHRVCDRFGEKSVDGLNMITMLLPATPIVYFGEELGLCSETKFSDEEISHQKNLNESHYKVFQSLIAARDTQTALYGDASLKMLNESVLALTRVNLGNPGYLLAYNPSDDDAIVDLSELSYVPGDLMLSVKSVGSNAHLSKGQDKIKSNSVHLEPQSAALFTFAPKVAE